MTLSMPLPRGTLIAATVVCALVCTGCAGLRGPRIDPSGERLLIWPKDQPQAIAGPVVTGNPLAPPAVTDPFFPAQPQAASAGAPVVAARPVQVLNVTPEQILAPVGSEVVLKANICDNDDGYTVAHQKIEWALGRNGVGQFVELGGKGHVHQAWLPWRKGKKVDNYLATGYTAAVPLCITRGTADPSDDVNILRGDAWVSVTSPVEGTSYVTAHAPSVISWNERRSNATIHWVDVQWVFPPPTVSSGGQPQTLTTTVTRQSDGTPVAGYLVRYEVVDGGVAFAGQSPVSDTSGQVVEVLTGADGRASVEVSPTDSGAGSSRIDVQLIRPQGFGGGGSPRLVISQGASVVNWTDSAPYLPPDSNTSDPPFRTPPTMPRSQPIPTPSPGMPQLAVEINPTSGGDPEEGGSYRFQVRIANHGNAAATETTLNVRFDAGLSHLRDPNRELEIENANIGRIEPGGDWTGFLTFDTIRAGRQCIVATATSRETASQPEEECVNVVRPQAAAAAGVQITKQGPELGTERNTEEFIVTVRNTGEVALTNLEIIDEYPTAFLNPQTHRDDPDGQVVGNRVIWRVPRLAAGDVWQRPVEAVCVQATDLVKAVSIAKVSANNEQTGAMIQNATEQALEIRPARGAAPAPAPGGGSRLRVEIRGPTGPIRKGTPQSYVIIVTNPTAQVDDNVEVRAIFPRGLLIPDFDSIAGPPAVQYKWIEADSALEFTPVRGLRPTEDATYRFEATAVEAGNGQVIGAARSTNNPAVVQDAINVEIIDRQ